MILAATVSTYLMSLHGQGHGPGGRGGGGVWAALLINLTCFQGSSSLHTS